MDVKIEDKLKATKGVYCHGGKLRIHFKLPGESNYTKRSLSIEPTLNNIDFANMKLQAIKLDIASGMFKVDPEGFWLKHFPNEVKQPEFKLSTVEQCIELIRETRELELSYSSREKLRTGVNVMKRYGFLHKEINTITPRCIELLRKKMLRNLAPSTVREYLLVLRRALDEGVKNGELPMNPFQNASRLTTEKDPSEDDDVDPFTQEELERLLDVIHVPQTKRMTEFLAWSGLRPGEMKALAWEDVDLFKGIVHVKYNINRKGELKPPKTAAGIRKVELMPRALKVLKEQQEHTYMLAPINETLHLKHGRKKKIERRRVFLSRENKPFLRPELTTAPKQWAGWLRKAKLIHREPYQLRHFFASQMLMAKAEPAWLAKQLGHKDWGMIRTVYARWIVDERPEHRDEIAARLGQNNVPHMSQRHLTAI
ncbi:site-specific integrase [Pseudoalteromonas luteoviolacea]|uniref:tyrosine-type recombinase/integrase n=1 Tax=Pseudoalteromonas luteoviolacea TaxID=43657 RepID=UPI001F23C22E|nr:site-specific integrase [Pseudoalteromonas luteoviolacea]MCF6442067.1 site-specific integrase [Pseudoalteromonas luteoviolacea]